MPTEYDHRWSPCVLLWALAAVCLPLLSRAESATMSFMRLGAEQGLSQGAIMAVLQDQRGFLWLGSEDGLDRYDGYQLTHFIHRRGDPAAVPGNWISALAQDAAGRIWVGTDGDGLVWRDAADGRFQRPQSRSGRPLIDSQARVRKIIIDGSQRIWVATRQSGVIALDFAAGSAREYRHGGDATHSLSDDSVFAMAEDRSGQMWVGTNGGLDRIDPQSGRIIAYGDRLAALTADPRAPVRVSAVLPDSSGVVWVGTDRGLYRFDGAGAVALIRHSADDDSLPNDHVTAILEDDERRLWVGTSNGLALYDRRSGKFTTFQNEPANVDSLPDNHVLSLYQDRSGLLWVGTKSGGVASWNPRSWAFGHFRFREADRNNITSFAVDGSGTLWLGSFGGGVASVDPRDGGVRRYTRTRGSPARIGDDNVMALVADKRDRIWIGTMGAGVERLDARTGELQRYNYVAGDPRSLPASGVMSMLLGVHGEIWVGTYGGGIARIDANDGAVRRYPVSLNGGNGLSSDRATALAEDRDGLIWIGTDGGGLNVLDPASGRFKHFLHRQNDAGSLSSDTVYALHADPRGQLWVGTRGGGMDCLTGDPFSAEGLRFKNVSEGDGLPNGTVYGIEADAAGRLWLSTNRGLAEFDPRDRSVRTFRRSHGLQADEFNFGAHLRGPDGSVYFGGPNGYNAFKPERLRFNTRPPPVALTEVLKSNSPVSTTPYNLAGIDLKFRDNVVTFRFAALDFTGPKENRYQHRLEGFDGDWIDSGNLGQATYTNLSGGNYVFRVRAANSDGVWNDAGLSLAMKVEPPPWATWWARTLYGAGFAAIIAAVWYSQKRHVEREAAYVRRLEAEVEAQTAELNERNRMMETANAQLREASMTDPLTGLGNRRCLREAMISRQHAATSERSVLMMIDLDFLKPINDQHGHDAGDAVLISVAGILRSLFRPQDLIVRWGGDEFVVYCGDCGLDEASALAERVRAAVAKSIFRVATGVAARTSCSIGFAAMPFVAQHPAASDWEQAVNFADAALYRAKQDRNTWFGWAGTAAAADVPNLLAALDADADALEREGRLDVRRRPIEFEDTVDHLRAIRRPS